MPEKRIEKSVEEEGKRLPLVTNEKFADFLVKEFKMPAGKARETTFRYPQDKKEMMLFLKEWMPKASFESIDKILKRYLLGANQDYIKTNIQSLKDRGRDIAEYARLSYLEEEPKKFNEFLNREDAIIRILEEKMPNVSAEAIKKLVNKNGLLVLDRIVRDVKRQERKLEQLTDGNIEVFVLSTINLSQSLPPEKPNLKLLMGGPYCLADRETFEYLINKRFEGRRKGAQVGLHEPEREAFKEMENIIDEKGKINGDEIQIIYNKHMGYSYAARSRLDGILSWLTERGGWKKWEETEKSG